MLLVNRDTGDAIWIGMYEDEGAARSFAPKAEKLAESLKKYQSESTPKRALYEVAGSTQIEAKAVVERTLRAWKGHELEAVARDAAPEIELTSAGDIKVKGPQAAKEYNHNWVKAFPDARVEAKQIFSQGNTVIVEGVFTGTHDGTLKTPMGDVPATGRKVKGDFIQIFEVDRGLVRRNHLMFDQVQLIPHLGMPPPPHTHKAAPPPFQTPTQR